MLLELIDYKNRRVAIFKKNLVELAEWEIKHAQVIDLFFFTNIKYQILMEPNEIFFLVRTTNNFVFDIFSSTSGKSTALWVEKLKIIEIKTLSSINEIK